MAKVKRMIFICLTGIFIYVFSSIVLLPSSVVNAAVPNLINYQAKLTDKDGVPRQGTYSITFRIYDAETAGSLLWEETHAGVVVEKGIFSVLLGSVTALNLAFDKQYYLEIKIGTDVMSPRQKMASSAYAVKAGTADTISGILPTVKGGTGTSATAYCNLAANVTGILSVANGGTGYTSGTIARIKTGTYIGNGAATQIITGIGFRPKVVEIRGRGNVSYTGNWYSKTDQMGTYTHYVDPNVSQYTNDLIISLDNDGFTVGDGTGSAGENTNANGGIYDYYCF